MERELSWQELAEIVEAHETYYNYTQLAEFCDFYYPSATKVVVSIVQEYDDNNYYNTFSENNLTVFAGEQELRLPTDEVELLLLIAESAELNKALAEASPDHPLALLSDWHYDDVCNLELYGVERGDDLEADLTLLPSIPKKVYIKEEEDALLTDD